jgi:hypothetical protein
MVQRFRHRHTLGMKTPEMVQNSILLISVHLGHKRVIYAQKGIAVTGFSEDPRICMFVQIQYQS